MSVVTFGNQPFTAVKARATPLQFEQFAQGVRAVFGQWTALNLVTLHCDPRAGQNLLNEVLQWFDRSGEVYSDELELFFEDYFAAARSVVLEDDSMKEVSDVLHEMYCRCCRDDYSVVSHFVSLQPLYQQLNPIAQSMNATNDDDAETEGQLGYGDEMEEVAGEYTLGVPDIQERPVSAQENDRNRNNRRRKNVSHRTSDGWNEVR